MIDAYEIGIQLALQDDVSAGLDVINRGLAEVDKAIDVTSAKLVNLKVAEAAAGILTSGATMRPGTGPIPAQRADQQNEPEIASKQSTGSDDVSPSQGQVSAAPVTRHAEPTVVDQQNRGDQSVLDPQGTSQPIPVAAVTSPSVAPLSEQTNRPTTVHVEQSFEPPSSAGQLSSGIAPERRVGLPPVKTTYPMQLPLVSRTPSAAPERENEQPAKDVRVFTAAVAQAIAPSRRGPSGESFSMPAEREFQPSTQALGRATAPWSGVENPAPSQKPAAVQESAAAPPGRQQDKSEGTTGSVMLDGQLVGYWLAEQMAKEASRPPSSTSFFDPRQTPAWTASGSL